MKIEIYPYGGCSFFDEKINIPLWQEFLVLIMGPFIQILFIIILSMFLPTKVFSFYLEYSNWILFFNLLPIYPLDGGKLLFLSISKFFPFYSSCNFVFYFSFFVCILFFWIGLLFSHNFIFLLVFIFLLLKVLDEIGKTSFYFQKFLLERYLSDFSFLKEKTIWNIRKMNRTKYHFIWREGIFLSERKFLEKIFFQRHE